MFYLPKTPFWIKKLFNKLTWDQPAGNKTIYLTFDDGPDQNLTPFVLQELDKYNAKATFFCIGRNVEGHPNLYRAILDAGHRTGNHTNDHLDGWKTPVAKYLANIDQARTQIGSTLFRPPYGHIRPKQVKQLRTGPNPLQVVMWSVLSGDFDTGITPEKCLLNVIRNTRDGSIVVFHESRKAEERMCYALPRVLEYFSSRGFSFDSIPVK